MATAFLVLTLTCFLLGPVALSRLRAGSQHGRRHWVDRYLPWVVAALVAFEFAPEAIEEGGLTAILFLLLGLSLPSGLEQFFERFRRQTHILALVLALLGLLTHALADGSLLATGSSHSPSLSLAIAIHSIPVGAAVWWLTAPQFGRGVGMALIAGMVSATVVGFYFGVSLESYFGPEYWSWFRAAVAGSLLHVLFGRPHLHQH